MSSEDKIMVSICCLAYNHESYITDALEGFLMQKTDFKYEVLIHDDASTDRTAEIIRSYEQKYPEIIKPIYQTENQYSKGVKISSTFNYPRVKGKYIALCEGDDYWIDPHKLQKQTDYMKHNPDCTFCFHNALLRDGIKSLTKKSMIPSEQEYKKYFTDENKKYNAGDLQLLGFIPTASFLFPKNAIENLPDWYFKSPAGDMAIRLLATSYGYAYYMKDRMSVYRYHVKQSAMDRWRRNDDTHKKIQLADAFIATFDSFDVWTNKKYTDQLHVSKMYYEFRKEILKKNTDVFSDKKYWEYFKQLCFREKMRIYINFYFPEIAKVLRKLVPFGLRYKILK